MSRTIRLIGSSIGNCGRIEGCEYAPFEIIHVLAKNKLIFNTDTMVYTDDGRDVAAQRAFFAKVARVVKQTLNDGEFPLMLGGDHSCAIGTWSGAASFAQERGNDLGLIWIDAHMDAHRPDTSASGNLHGMPVAHLLGHGHAELISILHNNPKLKPENIVYFGIRSYEEPEEELLRQLGVKVYYQHLLDNLDFSQAFRQEFNTLAAKTNGHVGISLDLDGLRPEEIKAVGTPESGGIAAGEFLQTLATIDFSQLIAFEIAEFNPILDDGSSLKYVVNLIMQIISQVHE